jgi:hypothetical protein
MMVMRGTWRRSLRSSCKILTTVQGDRVQRHLFLTRNSVLMQVVIGYVSVRGVVEGGGESDKILLVYGMSDGSGSELTNAGPGEAPLAAGGGAGEGDGRREGEDGAVCEAASGQGLGDLNNSIR